MIKIILDLLKVRLINFSNLIHKSNSLTQSDSLDIITQVTDRSFYSLLGVSSAMEEFNLSFELNLLPPPNSP